MASAGVQVAPVVARDPGLGITLTSVSEVDSEISSLFDSDTYSDTEEAYDNPNLAIPRHPIPAMQDAFAESLIEATQDSDKQAMVEKPRLRNGDANTRRQQLLDQPKSSAPPAAQWRFRPGQKTHELRKLTAQISFGVYLLLNGMANSNESAVSILQGHIDEVDEFLETTMEDIALATADITDRIEYLQVPMTNMDFFEKMLENRDFRLQIVEGNENIEHVLARTSTALAQSVDDIREGLKATREFTLYLAEQQNGAWRMHRPDVIDIFEAMKGNTEGWLNALLDLQVKETTLNALLLKLNSIVSEMDRRAGEVSRRTRFSIQPFSLPSHSRSSSGTSGSSSQKTPRPSPSLSRRTRSPPPRLSLGLGAELGIGLTDSAYFELPTPKDAGSAAAASPIEEEPVELAAQDNLEATVESAPHTEVESKPENSTESIAVVEPEPKLDIPSPSAPEAPLVFEPEPEIVPVGQVDGERPQTVIIAAQATTQTGEMFILEPRTYTPIPPAPEPSPTVFDRRPEPTASPPFLGRPAVRVPTRSEGMLYDSSSSATVIRIDPDVEQPSSRLTASAQPVTMVRPASPPKSPEKQLPQKKSSLRQRVSLKTNPPESILVPPPSLPGVQRPAYSSPRFQTPDSAYGSDVERTNARSGAGGLSPPPRPRPPLVPSPQSDQQYFRPVQASPHSPLQQRPHTAGTVRPPAYQQHQRNAPSRMGGMSMLSNVTTMNPDSPSGRTLRKKKSAFGWLKKAFSLDEEERAAFEQRKKDQAKNPYYDGRSTVFLDGKRLR